MEIIVLSRVKYVYSLNLEVKILWRVLAMEGDICWVERMGDKLTRRYAREDFLSLYAPLRGGRIIESLDELSLKDNGRVNPYIYDAHFCFDDEQFYMSVYKNFIHSSDNRREICEFYNRGDR